jgi:gamma-glutamyltranspeptidase/glutathione hydrolase
MDYMKNQTYLCILALMCLGFACRQKMPTEQIAASTTGMVSAAHPLATLAGQKMLKKGGNAADAAVATAFALSVVEPSMSGLGGRQQIIIRLPNGEIRGIDATSQAPMAYDTASIPNDDRHGYYVIGIPGVVAGLGKLHAEYGSLPLAEVMAPAIRYAERGFPLLPRQARRHQAAAETMALYAGTTQYLLEEDSSAYDEGDRLVQKDLANTLRTIAEEGPDAFYKGAIAQRMVEDFTAKGGLVTLDDLANYRALDSRVVHGTYRDEYELHGLWLPSYGAITIGILQALDRLPIDDYSEEDWAAAHGLAIDLAYEHRRRQRRSDSIADRLVSAEFADSLAQVIRSRMQEGQLSYRSQDEPDSWQEPVGHTSHLSTADSSGMMIALTQSLGPNMGSKVMTPGLGFVYAVTNGRYLGIYEPGQRASSHITPFIVTREGAPFLVLGAAGGSRIVSAVTSVTSRVIDQGLPLDEALAAPRVHPDSDSLQMETHPGEGWKDEVIEALEQAGYPLKAIEEEARFGRIHAIRYDAATGQWIGAADPDWEGAAAGGRR